jgi:hypothetical protein
MTSFELLKKQYDSATADVERAEGVQMSILAELRSACTHLRLGEYKECGKPWRLSLDCGAEEDDWTMTVLQLRSDNRRKDIPERGIVEIFRGSDELCRQRKAGERYLVGSSAR